MLESKMTSTFQAWLTRIVVVTQRETSKSAGRACQGQRGRGKLRFACEELDTSLHSTRKDVRQAGGDVVPAGKCHKHSRKVNGELRSTSLTHVAAKVNILHTVESLAWLLAITWTVAHQAPLSVLFSRQEHWNG